MKTTPGRKPLIVCVTDTEYAAVKTNFSDGARETFQSAVLEHGFVQICFKLRRCFRDFVASIPSQVASFSA
jgi:hypothetical protein